MGVKFVFSRAGQASQPLIQARFPRHRASGKAIDAHHDPTTSNRRVEGGADTSGSPAKLSCFTTASRQGERSRAPPVAPADQIQEGGAEHLEEDRSLSNAGERGPAPRNRSGSLMSRRFSGLKLIKQRHWRPANQHRNASKAPGPAAETAQAMGPPPQGPARWRTGE